MTNRNGTTLTWYANNLPKAITKDANNSSIFEYGPNRARWKHIYKTGGTTFTHTYIGDQMEQVVSGGVTEFKHFIVVRGQSIALYSRKSTGTNAIFYRHDDHLGSTEHLTDGAGSNVVMQSFGAYGQRRGTNWTGTPTPSELATINSTTRKGFTEHEMLDSTELVHMNGRVFDPVTGRFVSADPFEDCGLGTQGRNRYGYVGNRALTMVDPSGFLCVSLTFGSDGWLIGGGCSGYSFFDELWIGFFPQPSGEIYSQDPPPPTGQECLDADARCQQFGGIECEIARDVCGRDGAAETLADSIRIDAVSCARGGFGYRPGACVDEQECFETAERELRKCSASIFRGPAAARICIECWKYYQGQCPGKQRARSCEATQDFLRSEY